MSRSIVVGYTATDSGADALVLGARLAAASGSQLEIVIVLPSDDRSVITPPDAGFDRHLREVARQWLASAAELLQDAVAHSGHIRYGESFAEGLIAAAAEFSASYIVVGAGSGGLRGKHRLGTVASELLHSSDVPVVLAPEGARHNSPGVAIARVTAAVGTRPGADALLAEAVALAAASGANLRLISLATVDMPPGTDTGAIRLTGASHAHDVLAQAHDQLPQGVDAQVLVGTGESIEDAVQEVGWDPDEIVMVASSRLAQPRRLFLGSTAAKMLHVLSVPLIVVPRTRATEGARQ
ncbi:nucleotide-binding universal stress UspA family protein [Microbacterium endophyticum]|uniref:Nucleotide-binding universal stress UspA family protein n=1 Tax=Microbacterium endophyticum TaxID=1526412 RepID=A0A7W4YMM5_9MICO|nr:universal stress protein [Microbacterium endophyticum]MBB2976630.1 nucleotide-binding universal stress UspA family protein [Microbacterium endophyticum]NIK37487.1 nucleotide-binding universal stress UspA family protein [Microbacterium endophyticum]